MIIVGSFIYSLSHFRLGFREKSKFELLKIVHFSMVIVAAIMLDFPHESILEVKGILFGCWVNVCSSCYFLFLEI